MRITPKQFALSLYESADGKSGGEVKAIIGKFVELLDRKNSLAKAEKIIKEFIKIWNERRGLVAAEIVSASDLSRETVKLLKDYIKKLSGAEEVVITEKADKRILGGVIIRYGDKVIDGSVKYYLSELKDNFIK